MRLRRGLGYPTQITVPHVFTVCNLALQKNFLHMHKNYQNDYLDAFTTAKRSILQVYKKYYPAPPIKGVKSSCRSGLLLIMISIRIKFIFSSKQKWLFNHFCWHVPSRLFSSKISKLRKNVIVIDWLVVLVSENMTAYKKVQTSCFLHCS